MQQARIDIGVIKTELENERAKLTTASETAKEEIQIVINEKVGQLNSKIVNLEAQKTHIQTTINEAIKLCPLGGCSELRTSADTFARKVTENAPKIKEEVKSERAKVAETMKQRIADQDAQIKAQAAAVEAKRKEFERAFTDVQSNPSEQAKIILAAKMEEMKQAGEALQI